MLDDDFMVKEFILSLKGNAFNWCTNLESSLIDSWEQLKYEFLNHFYNSCHVISKIELTNAHQ
jgi:hypothetical protein